MIFSSFSISLIALSYYWKLISCSEILPKLLYCLLRSSSSASRISVFLSLLSAIFNFSSIQKSGYYFKNSSKFSWILSILSYFHSSIVSITSFYKSKVLVFFPWYLLKGTLSFWMALLKFRITFLFYFLVWR